MVILIFIGYVGSIGIATLSDSVIPYLGEILLNMPHREIHLGFIEKWWLVNPLALFGIGVAYLRPSTKFPHFGHVLLSTWASTLPYYYGFRTNLELVYLHCYFYFLFLSAWLNLFLFLGMVTWVRITIALVALGASIYSLRDYMTNKNAACKVTGTEKRQKSFYRIKKVSRAEASLDSFDRNYSFSICS